MVVYCIENIVSSQNVLTDYRRFLFDSLDSSAADEVELFSFHPYTLQFYLSLYPKPSAINPDHATHESIADRYHAILV